MTSRKKPGVAFWATMVVVAGLVAYPLSFGPACWMFENRLVPLRWIKTAETVFHPLGLAAQSSPNVWRVLYDYAHIGNPNPASVPCLMEMWIGVERD